MQIPTLENNPVSLIHLIGGEKGGVGKSLVCGILAVELARRGARVGILDADITGPSIPRMMGLAGARARGAPACVQDAGGCVAYGARRAGDRVRGAGAAASACRS